MRPIDADALTEDFKGRIKPCDKWIKEANEETKPRAEATRAFINEVILTIQDAPTIEPDRPHGEWIEQRDNYGDPYYECSVCKDSFITLEGTPKENHYNFCPNCGSDNQKKGGEDGCPNRS